jgi:hypothetical protein
MADDKPISDDEIWERLARARDILGEEQGATVAGNAALEEARKALAVLAAGLAADGEERDATAPMTIRSP